MRHTLLVVPSELFQNVLESTDPDVFNGGSDVEIQIFGADADTFEVTKLPQNWVFSGEVSVN